jgi:penicillin amidase
MGTQLADAYRAKANVSAVMIRALIERPDSAWIDRADTPEREDRSAILRRAFVAGVAELGQRLGGEPRTWTWGRLHALVLGHPLGALKVLAPYFDLGPHPMPGHALTVFKQESRDDFRVHMGPSLRYAFDLGDLAHGLGVIPGGQSGIRASAHYGDLFELWRSGRYHPLLTDCAEIDAASEGRLILAPARGR